MRHIRLIVALTMALFVAQILALSAEGVAVSKKPRTIIIPMENAEKNWKIFTMVNRLLSLNWKIYRTEQSYKDFPAGSFVICTKDQPISEEQTIKYVEELSQRYNIPVNLYNQPVQCQKRTVVQPKVGVLYTGSYGIGAQYVLEELGFEARAISYEEVRNKSLQKFNVLVVAGGYPNMKERLGKKGMQEIKSFVEEGGGYYGACGGACFAARLKIIPSSSLMESKPGFSGPIWIKIGNSSHPLWYGYKEKIMLAGWGGHFPQTDADSIKILGKYDKVSPGFHIHNINAYEVSKYIPEEWETLKKILGQPLKPAHLLGKTAILEDNYRKGRVIITSLHPETPELEQGYSVLANALFYLSQKKAQGREHYQVEKTTFESLDLLEKKIDLILSDIRKLHHLIDDVFHFGVENGFWYTPKNWPKWEYICPSFSFYTCRSRQVYADEMLRHAEDLSSMLDSIGEIEIIKLRKKNETRSARKILNTAESKIDLFYTALSALDQERHIKQLEESLESFNTEYKKLILFSNELKIAEKEKTDKEVIVLIRTKYEDQKEKVLGTRSTSSHPALSQSEISFWNLFDSVVDGMSDLKFKAAEADKWIDYALFCLAE